MPPRRSPPRATSLGGWARTLSSRCLRIATVRPMAQTLGLQRFGAETPRRWTDQELQENARFREERSTGEYCGRKSVGMDIHAQPTQQDIAEELSLLRRSIDSIAEQVRLSRVPLSRLFSLDEAAELLGASARTVRRLIDRGKLQGVQLPSARGRGTVLRVQLSDLQAFIDRQRTAPPPEQARIRVRGKNSQRKVLVPRVRL